MTQKPRKRPKPSAFEAYRNAERRMERILETGAEIGCDTPAEVAGLLGMRSDHFAESVRRNARLDFWQKLAGALNVTIGYLLDE